MILDIAILPTDLQQAIKNGEAIAFVENGQPIAPPKIHKINDGDYDIAEMDAALNAPSVEVPKFETVAELEHWMTHLRDEDFK